MDLTYVKDVKSIFGARKLRPNKRFGQNFLVDRRAVGQFVEAAELSQGDTVLEIGPGLGVLTQELAKRAKKIVAVEKDLNLAGILNNELRIMGIKNVEIIRGDIRRIHNSEFLIPNSYKVVGNLPFYLTARIIRQFLESQNRPKLMVLGVQKEVAQKICAKPPDMNLLAVSVQIYAEPKIVSYISKKSFWPSPEVDAAIIKITPRVSRTVLDTLLFFEIVKAGFSQPRKQLINNLSAGLKIDKGKAGEWLSKNNIQPSQRAETLTVNDWIELTESLNPVVRV